MRAEMTWSDYKLDFNRRRPYGVTIEEESSSSDSDSDDATAGPRPSSHPLVFSAGDVVQHTSRGTGEVVKVDSRHVYVRFHSSKTHHLKYYDVDCKKLIRVRGDREVREVSEHNRDSSIPFHAGCKRARTETTNDRMTHHKRRRTENKLSSVVQVPTRPPFPTCLSVSCANMPPPEKVSRFMYCPAPPIVCKH